MILQQLWSSFLLSPPYTTTKDVDARGKTAIVFPPVSVSVCITNYPQTCEKSETIVTELCPTLCSPMDCNLPDSSVHEILQARILKWVALPFSRRSFQPRDGTQVSHNADRFFFFSIWATRDLSGLQQWAIYSVYRVGSLGWTQWGDPTAVLTGLTHVPAVSCHPDECSASEDWLTVQIMEVTGSYVSYPSG